MWWMNRASTQLVALSVAQRDRRCHCHDCAHEYCCPCRRRGGQHQERRELQSGADAAALALAQDCARSHAGPRSRVHDRQAFANANAHDALARIVQITPAGNQITVRVGTEQPGGGADHDTKTIDFTFARVFGVDGRDISASATARWSPVSAATTVPLTFSRCEWEQETGDGTHFYHLNASAS